MTTELPPLTTELAYAAIQDFFRDSKPFVMFGTGTSCALDGCFGMPALEAHLKAEVPKGLTEGQSNQWQSVVNALEEKSHDFESAMDFISDEALISRVVKITSNFLVAKDRHYSMAVLNGEIDWVAGKMFKQLVQTLPESDPILHAATPNYDLLAEYSFTHEEVEYLTGFCGGFIRNYDWKKASKGTEISKKVIRSRKMWNAPRHKKHVRLYKPHGSLNTFETDRMVIECDAWMGCCPEGVSPAMVTPGTSKYQRLHDDRAQLTAYDKAVKEHAAFLFLGFGFNDTQLVNNQFRQKLQRDRCPAIVITRSLNSRIENWMNDCPNMWVVCKQEGNEFTRVLNSQYSTPLLISDKSLWCVDHFATEFLGA